MCSFRFALNCSVCSYISLCTVWILMVVRHVFVFRETQNDRQLLHFDGKLILQDNLAAYYEIRLDLTESQGRNGHDKNFFLL